MLSRHRLALGFAAPVSRILHLESPARPSGRGWSGSSRSHLPADEAKYDNWAQVAREGGTTVRAQKFTVLEEDDDAAIKLLKTSKRWSIHALFRSLADLELDVETDA